MPAYFELSTLAALLLAIPTLAEKQNINYYFRPQSGNYQCEVSYSDGTDLSIDCGPGDKYGGCAWTLNAAGTENGIMWCCPPGGLSPFTREKGCLLMGTQIRRAGDGRALASRGERRVGAEQPLGAAMKSTKTAKYEDLGSHPSIRSLKLLPVRSRENQSLPSKTDLFRNPMRTAPASLPPNTSGTTYTRTIEVSAAPELFGTTVASTTTLPTSVEAASTRLSITSTVPSETKIPKTSDSGGVGISAGAAAGIGIGGVLAFLAIVAGVFLLLRRRRQKLDIERNASASKLTPGSQGSVYVCVEADGLETPIHELHSKGRPYELDAGARSGELEGSPLVHVRSPVMSLENTNHG
ncbi:hypothetical protein FN846DRAFT_894081 [Sphaerosporella brunnea]|uniref:Uncharacterized protein n=1 Tax=Sphaerosporella brunnea TaxID=1250544 RepID=A0A5J5EK93_9PEZI|nr:hypothetical protein FN846DRAFT_894081 [Sphaerosporella brunnea]